MQFPPNEVPTNDSSQPPRRLRFLWAAAAVVVVLALVVLALRGGWPSPQSDQLAGFRVQTALFAGGDDAIVSGIVEIDEESGCVWLSDPSGARYPVVWPRGTSARLDPVRIVVPGGEAVVTGDRAEGGGGYGAANTVTSGLGMDPFPAECLQVGEAAVFNAGSSITVTPGVGLDVAETFVTRFTAPQPIGLQLIAVNSNRRSVAVVDFVTGTVHQYDPVDYVAPADVIDGASGGGGFTHLWANGTVSTYWPIDSDPLVFQPEPLMEIQGIAPTLEVLPAPDGDHTWLTQTGIDDHPTLIELVNVVGFELSRVMTTEIDGIWHPIGSNVDGLVLATDEDEPRTIVIGTEGAVLGEASGTALSVGWEGVVLVQSDGSLVLTNTRLENPVEIDKPAEGEWQAVGGPMVPATSPPMRTGSTRYLVQLVDDPADGDIVSSGRLISIDPNGNTTELYEFAQGSHVASWSRADDWVVVVEGSSVTLIEMGNGAVTSLGELIPEDHYVLSAG